MSDRLATQTWPSQLLDLYRPSACERMARGDADDQVPLGERRELERGRLGVRWPERRRLGEDREVERARSQRAGERGRGALAQRDLELGGSGASAFGHEACRRGREGAEPHGADRRSARRLADGGVELVEDPDRARQQPGSRRGQTDAVAAAVEQSTAGDGLERRHLAGDGRLRVAERARRGRERAGLRDLAQDPQAR